MFQDRVLSGMRPTGAMHLGHYHGALKNWVRLQEEYECLFFAADWHALTTHYETPENIASSVWEMMVDWLAAGLDPARALSEGRAGLAGRIRHVSRDRAGTGDRGPEKRRASN